MSRTYTYQELQSRSLSELHVLRGALTRELALVPQYSAQAREIYLSLDAVSRIIRQRTMGPGMG